MGIVFRNAVSLAENEAIYIDLPADTDIFNLDGCGDYFHWVPGTGSATQVAMGEVGTYTRGPGLAMDHF
jgi:hypothetical protein